MIANNTYSKKYIYIPHTCYAVERLATHYNSEINYPTAPKIKNFKLPYNVWKGFYGRYNKDWYRTSPLDRITIYGYEPTFDQSSPPDKYREFKIGTCKDYKKFTEKNKKLFYDEYYNDGRELWEEIERAFRKENRLPILKVKIKRMGDMRVDDIIKTYRKFFHI